MDFENIIPILLIVLVILAVMFLILREVLCWYWKVNKMVELQEKQNSLLKKISTRLENGALSSAGRSSKEKQTIDNDYSDDEEISKNNLFK